MGEMTVGSELDALSLQVKWRYEGECWRYEATSDDWPGRQGVGRTIAEAVADLVAEIEGSLPLDQATTEALMAAGGDDAVAAWDQHIRGRRFAFLRTSGATAGHLITDFRAKGHSAPDACAWILSGVEPEGATALERVGMDSAGFADYLDHYCSVMEDKPWTLDYAVPAAKEWALARVPIDRATTYALAGTPLEDAAKDWEPLIAQTHRATDRLEVYLRLGLSPEEAANHEASFAAGVDVVAALETVAALRTVRRYPTKDPWA